MRLLLLLCLLLLATSFRAKAGSTDKLLDELTQALDKKNVYFKQRVDRIAALTTEFNAPKAGDEEKFAVGLRIYQEYKSFKYDSAFRYAQRLLQLAAASRKPAKLEASKLNLAFIQVSSGMFKEAFENLESIDPTPLDSASRVEFYFTKARAYADLADFNASAYYLPLYTAKAIAYSDTALQYCRPGSYQALSVQGFRYLKSGNLKASELLYSRILSLADLPLHQVAINASSAAYVAELLGKQDQALELLAQAAIADVQSATTETLALFKLSDFCYQRGDLKHAYIFIKNAREDAAFYNARLRQIQIGGIFTVIEGERVGIIERQRKTLGVYALATTALVLLVLAFAAVIFRQLRRLQRAEGIISAINDTLQTNNAHLSQLNHQLQAVNQQLNEVNVIKDEYIGYYFNITSEYIDRVEGFKNALEKSLQSKQYSSTQRIVDSINIKKERNDLFKGFDGVFLKLFPHFIADFNALLKPDEQIHLAEDQLLTAELRIFALIRLGIDDSERISKILGYTISTVYTYKARAKKKSGYPNEEFEDRVRAIQAVQGI
ncbi:MAG: tetratricopeptide repeat protein [Hymenobacter sp.]|nr:MAG: tetratricopeptide repeat protein [Hymenobacter sp.]